MDESAVAFAVIDECFEYLIQQDQIPAKFRIQMHSYRKDFRRFNEEFAIKYGEPVERRAS